MSCLIEENQIVDHWAFDKMYGPIHHHITGSFIYQIGRTSAISQNMASHFQLRSGTDSIDWRTRISELIRANVDLYRMQEDVQVATLYKPMSNMACIYKPRTKNSMRLSSSLQDVGATVEMPVFGLLKCLSIIN